VNKQTHKKSPAASTKKEQTMIVNENALLLDFLLTNMSEKSRNSVKSLLKHGQIVVNGKTVTRYDYPLKSGDKIIVGNHRSIVEKNIPQLRILYEDDDIIVIDKEAGLLTITTGSGIDTTAVSLLKDYVQKQSPYNKIYTVHRLDQLTSGVLVFAKIAKHSISCVIIGAIWLPNAHMWLL